MIYWLALLGLIVVAALLVWWKRGWRSSLVVLLLVSLTVVTRNIDVPGYGVVRLTVPGLAVIGVAAIAILSFSSALRSKRFIPLLVYLLVLACLHWDYNQRALTGLYIIVTMVAAWIAGVWMFNMLQQGRVSERLVAATLLAVVSVEALVCVLQLLGAPIFQTSEITAELTAGRTSGTYGHPGNLGKGMILATVILLVLAGSTDRIVRRISYVGILLAVIPVGLSQGRSNYAAFFVLILLWVVLLPWRDNLKIKIGLPVASIFAAAVFAPKILERFGSDPEGGQRDHFMKVALEHMPDTLWLGVGPGNFIDAFGVYDTLVAQGWPVHNFFVLEAAELGLAGALLLFIPLAVWPGIRALRSLSMVGLPAVYSRALISGIASVIVLGVTGWGLGSGILAPLTSFVLAFAYAGTVFKQKRGDSLMRQDYALSSSVRTVGPTPTSDGEN